MKLLITGATGFIGSRLALEARHRKLDVVVAGQLNSNAEKARLAELEAADVDVMLGPLQEPEFARRVVSGCNVVIHLAAAQHEANVPDSYFRNVNVLGTRTLLEASLAEGVQRFVYGSTIGVYGSATKGAIDESTPTNPVNIYGVTKLEAEGVVSSYAQSLQTSIVRISETYGPGDFRLLKLFKAIDAGRFFMIGSGLNRRQVIHVTDLVRGLLLASEHPAAVGQTFVMAGQETMTTRDMVKSIATALGRKQSGIQVPLAPFLAAAILFEATFKPLGIQPPLHRRRLDFFKKSFVFSTNHAQQMLGFAPSISFAQGARECVQWYRDHGHLAG